MSFPNPVTLKTFVVVFPFQVAGVFLLTLLAIYHPLFAEDSPEDLFKAGVAAFQTGDYNKAAKNFEAVLSVGPSGEALESVLFALASTFYNQKDLKKAEDYYNRCLKEVPDGKNKTKALIAISGIQKQTGRKADAEKTLKMASEGTGDMAGQARLAVAETQAEAGHAEEAAATIRPMLEGGIKDDASVDAAMALARIESKLGHLDEALNLLDKLQMAAEVVDNPLQLDFLAVNIGDGFLAKGERKKALRMYAVVRPKAVVIDLQKARIATLEQKIVDNKATLQTNPKAFMEVNAANAKIQSDIDDKKRALAQYEKAPDTVNAVRVRQARAYDELDRKWETILIWESLLEGADPKLREDALFSIGSAYCSLGRSDDAALALDKYLSDFPNGKYASQAGYLKGAVALEAGNLVKAETVFGSRLEHGDSSALAADMLFLLANSRFAQGADPKNPKPAKYKDAIGDYQKYLKKYPDGKFSEECLYRIALCSFQLGEYAKALDGFLEYSKKYPEGVFAGDCGYRIALCYQAANQYDEVIKRCTEWLKKRNGEQMQAEVLALLGDAYAAKEMSDDAADAYRRSVKLGESDELLKYSLFQANTQYQKRDRWNEIGEMFSEFVDRHPDHPASVAAVFWVSKAKLKDGKGEEAKRYLAKNILKNINDRRKDAVEMLLSQLAQTCSKRPRALLIKKDSAVPSQPIPSVPLAPNASPTPRPSATPLPPYDAVADLAKYLNESNVGSSPLALARLRFAQAQLAGYTRKPDRQKELMASIYGDFKADQLSAQLLAECGDIALEKEEIDKAESFYKELMISFPQSDLLEYAYYGMGMVSLARNQPDKAIHWFDDAVEKAAAEAKIADITYGKGRALLALGKLDEAKKIFQQVASAKEWRGEVTARALLSLGELEEKRGNTADAIQYYQRVFVAYQRYPDVVGSSYLKAADAFIKLGQSDKAAAHLREMLSKPRLAQSPLAAEARKKLESLPPPPGAK